MTNLHRTGAKAFANVAGDGRSSTTAHRAFEVAPDCPVFRNPIGIRFLERRSISCHGTRCEVRCRSWPGSDNSIKQMRACKSCEASTIQTVVRRSCDNIGIKAFGAWKQAMLPRAKSCASSVITSIFSTDKALATAPAFPGGTRARPGMHLSARYRQVPGLKTPKKRIRKLGCPLGHSPIGELLEVRSCHMQCHA
jgi:hypothetical protein